MANPPRPRRLSKSQTISIRQAHLTDAPSIASLGAHVFTETFAYSVQPHELQAFLTESYSVSAITQDLSDPTREIIVATNPNDEILGFAYLTHGTSEPCIAHVEDQVELQRIYVHPEAHGKGVGGLLAGEVESIARKQGFKWMWLGVWEENLKAIRAYERWGYEFVGDHDFTIGSVVQTDLIMLKSLVD